MIREKELGQRVPLVTGARVRAATYPAVIQRGGETGKSRSGCSLAADDYLDHLPGRRRKVPSQPIFLRAYLDHLPIRCVRGQNKVTHLVSHGYI